MERIICRLGAVDITTHLCGDVVLVQLSDTHFIVHFIYDGDDSLSTVTVDIDDVSCDDTADATITFLRNPKTWNIFNEKGSSSKNIPIFDDIILKVSVTEKTEYSLLQEAISGCTELRDSTLRLESVYRDVYYAGVYSQLRNGRNEVITDELVAQWKHADTGEDDCESFSIFRQRSPQLIKKSKHAPSADNLDVNNGNGIKKALKAIDEYNSKSSKGIAISCTFCEICSIDPVAKDLKFLHHPYVMKTFSNTDIFMCLKCLKNWKLYRDLAINDSRLLLPGEVNEELCAVCSDCPQKIILCSGCQRSFCESCLVRILEQKELDELRDEKKDWICMCCAVEFPSKPDIEEEAWQFVKLINGFYSGDKSHGTYKYASYHPKSYTNSNILRKQANSMPAINGNNMVKKGNTIITTKKPIVQASPNYDFQNDELIQFVVCGTEKRNVENNCSRGYNATKGKSSSNTSHKTNQVYKYAMNTSDNMAPEGLLPPVDPNKDEYYYFGQYLLLIEKKTPAYFRGQSDDTEDVCFLCKDGGDLVECDYNKRTKHRCRKVYHTYCLSFKEEIPDDKKWTCPRHFCSMCGADPKRLAYECKYCPLSLCKKCPEVLVRNHGMKNYLSLSENKDGSGIISFVCQSCLEMYNMLKGKGDLKSLTLNGENMCFPGESPIEYEIQNINGKKKANSTSNNRSKFSHPGHTVLDNPYQRVFTIRRSDFTPKEPTENQASPPIVKKMKSPDYEMNTSTTINKVKGVKRKVIEPNYVHTKNREPSAVKDYDVDHYTNLSIINLLKESNTALLKSFDDNTEPEESISTVSIDDGKTSAASSPTS